MTNGPDKSRQRPALDGKLRPIPTAGLKRLTGLKPLSTAGLKAVGELKSRRVPPAAREPDVLDAQAPRTA